MYHHKNTPTDTTISQEERKKKKNTADSCDKPWAELKLRERKGKRVKTLFAFILGSKTTTDRETENPLQTERERGGKTGITLSGFPDQ